MRKTQEKAIGLAYLLILFVFTLVLNGYQVKAAILLRNRAIDGDKLLTQRQSSVYSEYSKYEQLALIANEPYTGYAIVEYSGHITDFDKELLSRSGELLGFLPENSMLVFFHDAAINHIKSLKAVKDIWMVFANDKLSNSLEITLYNEEVQMSAVLTIILSIRDIPTVEEFEAKLENISSIMGSERIPLFVDTNSRSLLTYEVEIQKNDVFQLMNWEEIISLDLVEEVISDQDKSNVEAIRDDDHYKLIMGDGSVLWDRWTDQEYDGYHGDGETIGVYDLVIQQDDIAVEGKAFRLSGNYTETSDRHGTQVAAVAAGNYLDDYSCSWGTNGTIDFRGIAYESDIIDLTVSTRPYFHINSFDDSYLNHGVRIFVSSTGGGTRGDYTIDTFRIDSFIYDRKYPQIFKAMGNNLDDEPNRPYVRNGAACKNCITVGGEQGYGLEEGPYVTNFSGKGPTRDGRIKPDIVAPYQTATTKYDVGEFKIITEKGTSFAAPFAAGGAVLLRRHLFDEEGINPSAALLKAIIVNEAVKTRYQRQNGKISPGLANYAHDFSIFDNEVLYDDQIFDQGAFIQGWGRINLKDSINIQTETGVKSKEYVDYTSGISNGEIVTFSFDIQEASDVKMSLVWTDPPASLYSAVNLVNDLDLRVHTPSLQWGNSFSDLNPRPGVDRVNNTERFQETLEPGSYLVDVMGFNIPVGPQDFALVLSADTPISNFSQSSFLGVDFVGLEDNVIVNGITPIIIRDRSVPSAQISLEWGEGRSPDEYNILSLTYMQNNLYYGLFDTSQLSEGLYTIRFTATANGETLEDDREVLVKKTRSFRSVQIQEEDVLLPEFTTNNSGDLYFFMVDDDADDADLEFHSLKTYDENGAPVQGASIYGRYAWNHPVSGNEQVYHFNNIIKNVGPDNHSNYAVIMSRYYGISSDIVISFYYDEALQTFSQNNTFDLPIYSIFGGSHSYTPPFISDNYDVYAIADDELYKHPVPPDDVSSDSTNDHFSVQSGAKRSAINCLGQNFVLYNGGVSIYSENGSLLQSIDNSIYDGQSEIPFSDIVSVHPSGCEIYLASATKIYVIGLNGEFKRSYTTGQTLSNPEIIATSDGTLHLFDATQKVVLVSHPSPSVEVHVKLNGALDHSGTNVRLRQNQTQIASSITDAKGKAFFSDLDSGAYQVEMDHDTYVFEEKEGLVVSDELVLAYSGADLGLGPCSKNVGNCLFGGNAATETVDLRWISMRRAQSLPELRANYQFDTDWLMGHFGESNRASFITEEGSRADINQDGAVDEKDGRLILQTWFSVAGWQWRHELTGCLAVGNPACTLAEAKDRCVRPSRTSEQCEILQDGSKFPITPRNLDLDNNNIVDWSDYTFFGKYYDSVDWNVVGVADANLDGAVDLLDFEMLRSVFFCDDNCGDPTNFYNNSRQCAGNPFDSTGLGAEGCTIQKAEDKEDDCHLRCARYHRPPTNNPYVQGNPAISPEVEDQAFIGWEAVDFNKNRNINLDDFTILRRNIFKGRGDTTTEGYERADWHRLDGGGSVNVDDFIEFLRGRDRCFDLQRISIDLCSLCDDDSLNDPIDCVF